MHKRVDYEQIRTIILKICQFAVEKGIQIQGALISVCHEMTSEEAIKADRKRNADLEIAPPTSGKAQGSDESKCYELPSGNMARIVTTSLVIAAIIYYSLDGYCSSRSLTIEYECYNIESIVK